MDYVPVPDVDGGWRRLTSNRDLHSVAGVDRTKLDEAFGLLQRETRNGGLVVVRGGWLVYERYFGLGHPDATPNLASCGKSFTGIAMGILLHEFPERFPDGLNQKVYTPDYLPESAFPAGDPRKADITLGQLLAFSAGIRGNNPSYMRGEPVTLDPLGPDGWQASIDEVALGLRDCEIKPAGASAPIPWSHSETASLTRSHLRGTSENCSFSFCSPMAA